MSLGTERTRQEARVCFVGGPQPWMAGAATALEGLTGEVERRPHLDPSLFDAEYAFILADYDALSTAERQHLLRPAKGRAPVVVVSHGGCRADFVQLFGSHALTHLLARNEGVDPAELRVTARKLLTGDLFGIDQYFSPAAQSRSLELTSSEERMDVIAAASAFATGPSVVNRVLDTFCSVVDELMTNAFYNAPVDAHGNSLHGFTSRIQEVSLPPERAVSVQLRREEDRLGVSVTDAFGSLTAERVLDNLAKCFRGGDDQIDRKPGGAGLGFYYVFESLTQLVINIERGARTEVIGVLEGTSRYRSFAARQKSFNLFVKR